MRWIGGQIITTKLLRITANDFKIESGLTLPHLQEQFSISDGLCMDVILLNASKFAVFYTIRDTDHTTSQERYEAASFRCEEIKGFIRLFSVWKYDKRLAQMAIRRSVNALFCHQ